MNHIRQHPQWTLAFLAIVLLLTILISSTQGAVSVRLDEILQILLHPLLQATAEPPNPLHHAVIWNIRLPRILTAVIVGAGLGVAGACVQGLFRNPLADPTLIGVSAGGVAGAFGWILLGGSIPGLHAFLGVPGLPLSAMLGAFGTTFLVYRLGQINGTVQIALLLLVGIAINALVGAFTGFLFFIADDNQLRSITFWTLGSLGAVRWQELRIAAIVIPGLILLSLRFSSPLNALLLGEAEAGSLGFRMPAIKRSIILVVAAISGTAVALCGMIGFVGLVVPHILRLLQGSDHRHVIPGSALLGALLLVVADWIARTVAAPAEIPVGVITSLLGAPFFLGLILNTRRQLTSL